MKVLVVGRSGQLARCLAESRVEQSSLEVAFASRPELDLEQPGCAAAAIRAASPALVINAAAYTAVDRAEKERARAFRVNGNAAGELAAAAHGMGAPIIHLSTDYVFDGLAKRPYCEDDPVGPINVYGASKLAGEEQVRTANPRHVILRTSWVVSAFGNNFVRTMLRLASDRDEVSVVADQRGCPTSAHDLARFILNLASCRELPAGTFHVAGASACSWAEFAEGIFSASTKLGGPSALVRSIPTSDYPTSATRPFSSALDCSKAKRTFGRPLQGWQEAVQPIVGRLLQEG